MTDLSKQKDYLSSFSSYLLLTTTYLIVCGYLDLASYYLFYNIRITRYIGTSEIILNTFENILSTVFRFILYFVFAFLYVVFYKQVNKNFIYTGRRLRFLFKIIKENNKWTKYLPLIALIVALLLNFIIFKIVGKFEVLIVSFTNILLGITCIATIIEVSLQLNKVITYFKINIPYQNSLKRVFLITICSMPIIIILDNIYKYYENLYYHQPYTIQKYYFENNVSIETSDSIVNIGKTSDYIILWNNQTEESTLIPTSEIKKITSKLNDQ